jgi:hypothetical protein
VPSAPGSPAPVAASGEQVARGERQQAAHAGRPRLRRHERLHAEVRLEILGEEPCVLKEGVSVCVCVCEKEGRIKRERGRQKERENVCGPSPNSGLTSRGCRRARVRLPRLGPIPVLCVAEEACAAGDAGLQRPGHEGGVLQGGDLLAVEAANDLSGG